MKKVLTILLAAVLAVVLSASALADFTLTEVSTLQDAQWISDSNLLRVTTKDGYAVYRIDGSLVVNEAFGSVSCEYGYLVAAKVDGGLNSYGVYDAAGNQVIPSQYGDIKFLTKDWVLGFKLAEATADHYDYTSWGKKDTYYIIDTVDVYNLSAGACMASFPRANYKDAYAEGTVINIEDRANGTVTAYDGSFAALGNPRSVYSDEFFKPELVTYRENGQYGLKDAAGNEVMKPSFYSIYDFNGEYAVVSTGEKEGLIDRQGNVVVAAEYDEIKRGYYAPYDALYEEENYNAAGYFAVIVDDKLGFVNEQGVVTCEPKYSQKIMELYGASAVYTDMESKTHILAADGVDTVVEGYDRMYCLDYSFGKLFRVNDADYNYGVIDWHGNVVLPCEYSGAELSGDGKYLLVDIDYENSVLYEIADTAVQAAPSAAQEATAAVEGNANTKLAQGAAGAKAALNTLLSGAAPEEQAPAAQEIPAEEAPAAEENMAAAPSAEAAAVVTLIDNAIVMLDTDAAANKAAIAGLLNSAVTLLGEGGASAMISSALTLLEVDAAANAVSIKTILETAKTML